MAKANVLVVGSGGREHALCLALHDSPHVGTVHCVPGNAGTAHVAVNHTLESTTNEGYLRLAESNGIDLMVVGPEAPLCAGLADACAEVGLPCFGPVAALAHLEGSKLHAKETMAKAGVPTAAYLNLGPDADIDAALDSFSGQPWVVKRDVLAGGKGVVVTTNRAEAKAFIESSIATDGFVLLEAFLPGEEASMLVVMDGATFVPLPASQDHKRAYDGDLGPNTGGMGAYCPAPVVDDRVHDKIVEQIVKPMHRYLSSQSIPYRGVLFIGLMIDEHGDPYVVEFNVRFGDPECQVTLPLIASDVFELLNGAATDRLSQIKVEVEESFALTVVLASEGYPNTPIKGRQIEGLAQAIAHGEYRSSWVNLAGTTEAEGTFVATGGRVLSCTAMATDVESARQHAYDMIDSLALEGGHYRRDIAHRALARQNDETLL